MPVRPDIDQLWFTRPNGSVHSAGIHGVAHTERVRIHAREIAEALELSEVECEAIDYAALWHDIGRTNDWADYYHGAKSAGKVTALGLHLGLEPEVVELALFAVTHHSGSEQHAELAAAHTDHTDATLRVFRVLKDADGLDRVRLGGGDLNPSYLRHEVSKARVQRAWDLLHEIR